MFRALTPFGKLVILVVVASVAGTAFLIFRPREDGSENRLEVAERTFTTNDPIERACALPKRELLRIWRGHHEVHSEDITIVPQPPNFSGSFGTTSHSGPWDYVQTIPLVLYGPGNIARTGIIDTQANITDVFPTVGALTGVDLPARSGKLLDEALEPDARPKLIVTLMWDGVGRNVLDRWPGRWSTLAELEEEGTSYTAATVGSSPSITPATHSNLGTGAYPREHGVTAIAMRLEDGSIRPSFAAKDPSDLEISTYADEIDVALGNEPKVGMLAWRSWHMGMLGHGSMFPAGDKDEMALITGRLTGNRTLFTVPEYAKELPGPERRADELDQADGEADGKWRGHVILEEHDNPAWANYETDVVLEMLERGDYGVDEVPDLFFINYKPTDIVGHRYNIDSEEMGDVLEAQDDGLSRLVEWLDSEVKDYVLIVSSDHGNTTPAENSGGWPLLQGQLQLDVNAHFGIPSTESLISETTAVGPFLDSASLKEHDVTASAIARFLNSYTIADNWAEPELPSGYEERGDEHILAAAFPGNALTKVMRCAFDRRNPPSELEG